MTACIRRAPFADVHHMAVDGWGKRRRSAELFAFPGRLVAAAESRWMFATPAAQHYRYSIKDAAGSTVGEDFDARFNACSRTRSGVLGCQIGNAFYTVDLTTGSRVRLASIPAADEAHRPVPLSDGWVLGGHDGWRVVSESGGEMAGTRGRERRSHTVLRERRHRTGRRHLLTDDRPPSGSLRRYR